MSDDPRLKALLARRDEMRQRGDTVNLEALCADCPELLPVLRARIEHEAPHTDSHHEMLTSEFVAGTEIGAVVPRRGTMPVVPGFEIIKEVGRGGMGVIYKARHLKLGRLVALKMVLAGSHASRSALARFNVEAEAIASLDHPNIVQLYEVGEHESCPYLVLELIEGGDLDDLIENRPQEPRAAAQLVEALARAMHVAHLRGIVHRDLKPANILLQEDVSHRRNDAGEEGSFRSDTEAYGSSLRLGEGAAVIPKITDFGLAKRLESESHTQSGMVFGTPSYMAPEQAQGKVREIGPAADVYALGAILYACLTSKPPFSGTSLVDTLSLVRTGEVIPPRHLIFAGQLPRDLETICLKCLHKEPSGRYASAEALADDLRRFLNSEPIAARPVGRVERLRLWAKRRPALAGLVGVSVVAVLLLLAGGIWSDLQIRSALDRARRNEVKAQERLLAALAVGDDFYLEFATFWLDKQAGQDQRQLKFLEKALAHYRSLADQDSDEPALRARQGVAHMRMGQIFEKLRRTREAKEEYQKAVAVQTALHASSPEEASYRKELADTLNWQGELCRTTNDLTAAAASYADAIALLAPLGADRTARHQLGRTTYNSGLLVADSDPRTARSRYERAIELLTAVVQEDEQALDPRQDLAQAWLNLGALLHNLAQPREAENAYRKAIEQLEKLSRLDYKKPAYRYDRALALSNLGNLLTDGNQRELAEPQYRAAEQLLTRLADDFQDRPAYANELANVWNGLGRLFYVQQQDKLAEQFWHKAAQSWRTLLQQEGSNFQYLRRAGMVQGNLGLLHLDRQDDPKNAVVALEGAVRDLETAFALQPENKELGQLVVQRLRSLARAYVRTGASAGAATTGRKVLAHPAATDADRYAVAVVLARCATQATKSDAPVLAELAVKLLQRVDPQLLPNGSGVLGDAVFQVLRDRADFRALTTAWQQRKPQQ